MLSVSAARDRRLAGPANYLCNYLHLTANDRCGPEVLFETCVAMKLMMMIIIIFMKIAIMTTRTADLTEIHTTYFHIQISFYSYRYLHCRLQTRC